MEIAVTARLPSSSIGGLDPPKQKYFKICDGFGALKRLTVKGEAEMVTGFFYILASKRNGTLYVGSTNNLYGRMIAHREGKGSAFTAKYGVTMLVWFEEFEMVTAAIQRETNIKRWKRAWKLALIEKDNPQWRDLFLEME